MGRVESGTIRIEPVGYTCDAMMSYTKGEGVSMSASEKFRYRVQIDGVEVVTDHAFTKEEVQDIHRVMSKVAQIAAGNGREITPRDLVEAKR